MLLKIDIEVMYVATDITPACEKSFLPIARRQIILLITSFQCLKFGYCLPPMNIDISNVGKYFIHGIGNRYTTIIARMPGHTRLIDWANRTLPPRAR